MVVLVALSGFAGCGRRTTVTSSEVWVDEEYEESSSQLDEDSSNEQTSSAADNTSSVTSKNNSKTESGGNKNENGKIDLKGKEIVFSAWSSGAEPSKNSATYKEELALIKKIEKNYNCKVVYKTIYDSMEYYAAFVTAASAGVHFADIVYVPGDQAFPNAALNGYCRKLDDYFDWDSLQWNQGLTNGALLLNGHHYYLATSGGSTSAGTFFRFSLFEKFGEKTPHDYIAENNWNWNTFRDVCKRMTRKVGTTQYYGLSHIDLKGFMLSNNVERVKTMPDGSRKLNIDCKESIEAIRFVHDLYNVDKVIAVNSIHADSLWDSGYVAMSVTDSWVYANCEGVGFAYTPIGFSANDYTYDSCTVSLYIVPVTVKDSQMKAICAIMNDYLGVYKWRKTPTQSCEEMYGDEKSIEIAVDIIQRTMLSTKFDSYYEWTFRNVFWSDFGIGEQQSPQSFVNSVKKPAQAEIDATWAKLKNLK